MYCKECGKEVSPTLFVPGRCPGCKRPLTYGPSWVPTVAMLAMFGVAVAAIAGLRAAGLPTLAAIVAGVALGVLAFNLLQVALFRAGIMTSDDLVAQKPDALRRKRPARKLTAAQQIEANLSRVDLPEQSMRDGRQLAVQKPAPRRPAAAPAPASQPAPRHHGTYDEVRADDEAGIREMGALSTAIVREHFDPIIGTAQNDYMIERFNTAEAVADQLRNHGYRYFFVNDPRASASALPQDRHVGFLAFYPREAGELYLSKFYLLASHRGQGLSHDMLAFVADAGRELGCNHITLNVNRNNFQAILAYEHLGFRKVREEKNDIGSGYFMDDIVYEYAL